MRRLLAGIFVWAGVALAWTALSLGAAAPRRVISLIPAVTEMIYAMGGGTLLVGVSNYDRYPPDALRVAHVGGLLDPDTERILALRPDLVFVYNTQVELKQRLDRAGIAYYSYEHRTLADVVATTRSVGERIGRGPDGERLARSMEDGLERIRAAVARLPRPRTLLVIGRDAGSLAHITASGGYGFLHDMLETAGGADVFDDVKRQSLDVSTEMVLARRPEVIIELRYGESVKAQDLPRTLQPWTALAAVPAVRNHRVYAVVGDEFVVPGPRVVLATTRLADTLHPGAVR